MSIPSKYLILSKIDPSCPLRFFGGASGGPQSEPLGYHVPQALTPPMHLQTLQSFIVVFISKINYLRLIDKKSKLIPKNIFLNS